MSQLHLLSPRGFRSGATAAGIKSSGALDVGLLACENPASAAAVFTTSKVVSPAVLIGRKHIARGKLHGVVVNSGNANACTGRQGLRDAEAMARLAARELRLDASHVLVGSTGRIGVSMPMENVRQGIAAAAAALGGTTAHADQAAEAILTSDTRPKQAAVEFQVSGRRVRLGGICKGAGMIQPGMSATGARPAALPRGLHATMLCFLTTDAAIGSRLLQTALEESVAKSFNRITVDGDMSTNDTVLVLANGLAGHPSLRTARSRDFAAFQSALDHVCLSLARQIVRDGEGVHRVVTVRVSGAASLADADAAARAVANSSLVKTSWHGGDPNWGRIIDALGYSPARVVEDKVDIGYSPPDGRKVLWSLKRGQPTTASFRSLCAAVAPCEFELHIRLNLGRAAAVIYAADLTEAYVDFNKGDVTDPASLGG
jgi:glutamate N-acetyltransferase/amino-acid N-acetyltransferase